MERAAASPRAGTIQGSFVVGLKTLSVRGL